MKFNRFSTLLLSCFLASCSSADVYFQHIYLNCQYKLAYAGYIADYTLDIDPYFYVLLDQHPGSINYISCFDKDNSFANFIR